MKKNMQSLFFISFMSCGGFSLFASNMIMKLFPNTGHMILIILLPLNLILALIISTIKIRIKDIVNSKVLKILLLIYLLGCGYFSFYAYLNIISDYYYPLTSKIVIFLLIIWACYFFSYYGIKNIVKVGFVIAIVTLVLYLSTIFSETKHDFNLLNYNKLQFDHPFFMFSFLFVYLDGFITSIFLPHENISKKRAILYVLIVTITTEFFILENYLFFPGAYFDQIKYPYLLRYYTYRNSNFLEHLDILYLICTTIFFIFHFSIQLETFRILLKQKRKSKLVIIPPFILLAIYLFTNTINYSTFSIGIFMGILTILLLLFYIILFFKKKVIKHE